MYTIRGTLQLERCQRESEEIQSEVRRRDRDLERLQQDTSTEMEKVWNGREGGREGGVEDT